MSWRLPGAGMLVVIGVLLLAAVLWGRQLWLDTLEAHGIDQLDWQGLAVSLRGASVDQLKVTRITAANTLVVVADELVLNWHWQGLRPRLTAVTLGMAEFHWRDTGVGAPASRRQGQATLPALLEQLPEALPVWLPPRLDIAQFHGSVPCAVGRCPLSGALSVTTGDAGWPAEIYLTLDHKHHQLGLWATFAGRGADALQVTAELALDERPHVTLASEYTRQTAGGGMHWTGSLAVVDLPPVDWLLDWLQSWSPQPLDGLPAQPQAASMSARWQLQAPPGEGFWQGLSGTLAVDAQLPKPWSVPGVGSVAGEVVLSLQAEQGRWHPQMVQADVHMSQPAAWVEALPESLRPANLTLSLRPGEPLANTRSEQALLPLRLELTSQGGAELEVGAHLAVATAAPWRVQLAQARVRGALNHLTVGDWSLSDTRADLRVTGWADTSAAELAFGESTVIDVGQASGSEETGARADRVRVGFNGAQLVARYPGRGFTLDHLSLKGPVHLIANRVRHPQLQPRPWQFLGRVDGNLDRLNLNGVATASAIPMELHLRYSYQEDVQLAGDLQVSGAQETGALADLLAHWPPLLAITGGKVTAKLRYRQAAGGVPALSAELALAQVNGTYDRTEWVGMNGRAGLALGAERFTLEVPELTIAGVNPGVPVGPLSVVGRYQAPLAQFAAGQLTLQKATAAALGGQLTISADTWDLADPPVTLPVELTRLSLAQLLTVYPTEGLAGTGTLSGTLPLLFDPATGVQVQQGRIDALAPGGRLQLSAERLQTLARGNETMRLVATAMENFHYSVMGSGIDYDRDGNLTLSMHLEGHNPELQDGHPVVLNINLQENIPALLTSLQLSGRVSEAVAERVRQLLKKREHNPADLIE
ncbi:intermembrane phospholipid transport protein YdbH family protein [Marinobacter sp. X15-166B]|uniref:intermembrane phospholipid transport protein YdbH family protein n=1 Tax=Marinobacter sp. X15-166B TaxID=1897620 RepID=UPI00085C5DD9|nr:YdbH domain-containing protein [Marinobacter sp. X15-166B]OEY65361.1 hypothetical protein BG841_02065 [Marinobacter sp. X15-166B]